jgi:hypothetical protein
VQSPWQLLSANGVVALSENYWYSEEKLDVDGYVLLGFPDDTTSASLTLNDHSYSARVKGRLSLFYAEAVLGSCKDIPDTVYPQFAAKLAGGEEAGRIEGTSGGPIFGVRLRNGRLDDYRLVAIQSNWISRLRITLGCPLGTVLELASDFLRNS